jgi:hypothetical protein
MPPAGFEATISAGKQLKTYASDRTATGTGPQDNLISLNMAQAAHSCLDAQMHLLHILNSLQQNSPRPENIPSPNSNTFLSNTDQWFIQKSTSGHKVSIHFNEIATIYYLFQDSLEGCRMQKSGYCQRTVM